MKHQTCTDELRFAHYFIAREDYGTARDHIRRAYEQLGTRSPVMRLKCDQASWDAAVLAHKLDPQRHIAVVSERPA